jgi:hypothetical protein
VCVEATEGHFKLPVREGNVSVREMWGVQNHFLVMQCFPDGRLWPSIISAVDYLADGCPQTEYVVGDAPDARVKAHSQDQIIAVFSGRILNQKRLVRSQFNLSRNRANTASFMRNNNPSVKINVESQS